MRALVADADWEPKKEYQLSASESNNRHAVVGSQVWRNPRLEIREVPDPEPREDEVLIRVAACGICGSDTHTYETDANGYILFSGPAKLPSVLGHELSGEVVEVGKDVVGFSKGDLVTSESILWCGNCLSCRSGMLNQCENVQLMGLTTNGAFAEYIAVRSKYCWKLNGLADRFSKQDILNIGTLIEPIGCAYNGIFVSGGGYQPGAFAVVYGAGPIGLGAVMLLKISGAASVIAVDIIEKRLGLAKRLGADHVLDGHDMESVEQKILELTGGWGADIQVEAAGGRNTMRTIQKLAAKRGKIVYLGRAEASATMNLNSMVTGAIGMVGSRGHSGYGIYSNIIKLLHNGRLDSAREMITSVFPFAEIAAAFAASSSRQDGKISIQMP